VVDAHPLLIRWYLTTSNHNVNHEVGISDYVLGEKLLSGESFLQNGEN